MLVRGGSFVDETLISDINPFTAQDCKISGQKNWTHAPANSNMLQSYNKSNFNVTDFDENPFTCKYLEENKKAAGIEISHFYWLFSSDVMAVNGLILFLLNKKPKPIFVQTV